MNGNSKIHTRRRRFRPSEALMRDALNAAKAAGIHNPVLDIRPDGTLSVRQGNITKAQKDDAKSNWEKALGNTREA